MNDSNLKKGLSVVAEQRDWALLSDIGDIANFIHSLGNVVPFSNDGIYKNTITINEQVNSESNRSDDPDGLDYHTDYVATECPPKFGLIKCVRQDPGYPVFGETRLIELRNVIRNLEIDNNILFTQLQTNDLYSSLTENGAIKTYPIIDSKNIVRFDRSVLKYITDFVEPDWFTIFRNYFQSKGLYHNFCLASGEGFIFNNHKVLHARGKCTHSSPKTDSRVIEIIHFDINE